jgi:hypothetical protein
LSNRIGRRRGAQSASSILGAIVQADDPDSNIEPGANAALPVIGKLRLIALDTVTLQRRCGPRRRAAAAVEAERRRSERRKAKPGIDGLLRMVLADVWQEPPPSNGLRLIR